MALTEVFQNVCYYLKDGSLSKSGEINQLLRNGGGIRELFMNELVSHVITDQLLENEPGMSLNMSDSTVAVHSDWVRLSSHCGTLLSCTPFLMNRLRLFTNLTICSSQLSHTDKQKLWAMVLYYGGKLQNQLNSSVTHLVCMQTKGAKYDQATHRGISVVTADWILDCIEHETLLPTQDYHPSLLMYTEEQAALGDEENMEQEREKEGEMNNEKQEVEMEMKEQEVGMEKDREQDVEMEMKEQEVEMEKDKEQEVEMEKDKEQEVEMEMKEQEVEMEKDREQEVEMEMKEQEVEMEKDREQEVEMEKDKEQEVEMEKDKEQDVEMEKDEEQEVEMEKDKEQEVEMEKDKELQKDKELSPSQQMEKDREQEVEMEKDREQEVEMEKDKEQEVEMEKDREQEVEMEKDKEQEVEMEKDKEQEVEMEKDKEQEVEMEKDKEREQDKVDVGQEERLREADEEKEKLAEIKIARAEIKIARQEECHKGGMTNQPELLTEDENDQRKDLVLEEACDEEDGKHQLVEEMITEEKEEIKLEVLQEEKHDESESETAVVDREQVNDEEMTEIHSSKAEEEEERNCTNNEDRTIVLETCDVPEEVPTPTIPIQLELRRKRSLSAVQLVDYEQPETPVERKRARRDDLIDLTSRKNAPKILTDLVFCLVDYPQLMDSQTMEKWKEVVSHYGGTLTQSYNQQCTHLVAQHKKNSVFEEAFSDSKCIASAHWLNDVLAEKKMFPPKNPLHFPIARLDSPPGCENLTVSLTNYTGSERELVKEMARVAGIAYTGFLNKNTTHLICKRAGGRKYEKALEWGITIVNSVFLADIIHNGHAPAVLYSKHTVLDTEDEFSASCFEAFRLLKPWQTFLSSYSSAHPEWVNEETVHTSFKGLFPVKLSESHHSDGITEQSKEDPGEDTHVPCVLLTGLSSSVVRKMKQILHSLGGEFTTDPTKSTHLVAPRIARTVKFLSAISVCKYIVAPDWLENSMQAGKFLAEDAYILSDQEAETMFKMSVASSLSHAQNKKLLEGVNVYATTSVNPPPDSFRLIVECAGGKLLTSKHELTTQFGDKLEKMQPNSNFIVISSPDDVAAGLCTEFYNRQITVYNAEFLLTGVLRQELDYSNNQISLEQ